MSSESLAERLYAKTISLTYSAPDRSLTPQKCHEALAAEALAWMQERMPTRREITDLIERQMCGVCREPFERHVKRGGHNFDNIGGIPLQADAILALLSARTVAGENT
jgi:hypothetical protein